MSKYSWHLRSLLFAIFFITLVLAFTIVGCTLLLVRIPQIEQEARAGVARDVSQMTARVELILGALQSQLDLLSLPLQSMSLAQSVELLDKATGDGKSFRAIYLASDNGTVVASGLPNELRSRREDLLGSDLSATSLFKAAKSKNQMVWGDKYLSALSGAVTVGLARRIGPDRILVAEVPIAHILNTFQLASEEHGSFIWLADRMGEIVADTDDGRNVGVTNMLKQPLMQAALHGGAIPETFTHQGNTYYPAASHSNELDWYIFGGVPAGLANSEIRSVVYFVAVEFIGFLVVGLLLAPFGASWLTKPLRKILERADEITHGKAVGREWPRGHIREFNLLSEDLETMARAIQEREQKFLAIFNTSPVPMFVTDVGSSYTVIDANDAWCREFGREREAVIGRTTIELELWASMSQRENILERLKTESYGGEAWLLRADGQTIQSQVFGRLAQVGNTNLMVWATIDIGELRRIEKELRELNVELEARVSARTRALASANEELSETLASLRHTQAELVRAAKMAALGRLVAGVAHELNTPLGNGLLAVTSLTDKVEEFKGSMRDGMRRSALESFIESVEQGADIANKNLQRAADLVTSFKQVAVDQTSSQRRKFELFEIVDEMVVSLRPTLKRTPFQIVVDVPTTGLKLDSYPGALGQTIGNLIDNAVLHAFDGRDYGTIRIVGRLDSAGHIELDVVDDGVGIVPELLGRIFDPFVTTRMGRGGTGLGLHIAYNAVTNLLGGTLVATNVEGGGASFVITVPPEAPIAAIVP